MKDSKQDKWEKTHKIINEIDHKLCSKCNEYYPSTIRYFYKNKSNSIDGLHPYCINCTKKDSNKWIKNNPDKYKTIIKKQNDKPKNKIKRKEAERKRREEGKLSEWQRNNIDKIKTYNKNRRQNKSHNISKKEWELCKSYFDNQCAYCGIHISEHFIKYAGKLKHTDLHKEHVDDDGANDLSNCVPSCRDCNSAKHNFELNDWYNEANLKFTQERLDKILKWLNEDYLMHFEGVVK